MVRKQPPPGFLSSAQAADILGCSVGMVYNYERSGQLHKKTPPGRKQGYFLESEVRELANALDNFFDSNINDDVESIVEFRQATVEDVDGIYNVAASLFGSTTSAEARKPLIEKCAEGNYIVKRNSKIVAYIHIQPLKHDRMIAFMEGKIRGKDIIAEDLECFKPGQKTEVLIKSIGATKNIGSTDDNKLHNQKYFLMRLLRGTAREMAKLGHQGVEITKLYATSETLTGIRMAYNAKMDFFGKPIGEARFRYVLDVEKSDLPILQPYKKAFAEWKAKHHTELESAS